MNALSSFIDAYGTTKLAEELGVSVSLVSSWRHGRYRVAPRHCLAIERLSSGQVRAADMQPEVFGPQGGEPPRAAA
jgi:DNA-binding transcriptional regulator YdaS (Cro superfamily)